VSLDDLGRDLHLLADVLLDEDSPTRNAGAQAARRLRETQLDEPALMALARTARLPRSLVDAFVQDTVALLDRVDGSGIRERAAAAQRLQTMAWAWADVPATWPPLLEDETRARWAAEHPA
jgi:hypothetical protein